MSILTKIFVAFLIFITAAALLIILLYPGERTTTIVAITALLISTGKTGYDIYDKERERRKKAEEGRARITATAKYGMWDSSGRELGVVIYNAGSAPAHIACVECRYIPSDGTEVKTLEFSNISYKRSELLQPKHTARFRSGCFKDDLLGAMAKLPEKNIWISIKTLEGEEFKVEGKEILAALNAPPSNQLQ
jgi:hypothetical protein